MSHRRSRSRSRERDQGAHDGHYGPAGGSAGGGPPLGAPPLANYGMMTPLTTGGGMSNILMGAQNAANEKISRELFVGNTPPGTSEMLLMQFLNGAMRRVGLCQAQETPILHCRVNPKFAFIELVSSEAANKALSLNGIPFLGSVLKVSRPSKYTGPTVQAQTWQQLTGQELPSNVVLDSSATEKLNREIFVGNTTEEMTESMLRDFLGNAMLQVGLNVMPGNPIVVCRVSGKFAFIELRTPQEAANALNLNNIPYMGDLEASREDDSFRSHGDRVGSSEKQNVLEEANAIVADISAPNDNNVEAGDPVASRTVTEVSKPRQSMGELHVEKPVLSTAHPAPSADESHLSQSSDSRLVVCGKSPSPRKGCPWSSTRRTKRSTRKVVFSTYEETGPRESLGDRGGYPRPGSLGKTTSPVESHFAKRKSSLISTESQHASRFTSSRKWPVSGVAFCKQEVSQPRKKSSQEKPSMFDALLLSSSSDDDDSELVAEPLALSPETDPQIADRVDESKKSRKSGATSDEAIELLD